MTEKRIGCVLLAGAPADEETKARYNVVWRAEVPVAGRRMVDWVLDALRESGRIGEITLVGAMQSTADRVVGPGGSFLTNVMRGIDASGQSGMLMIASSDIPLVTGEAIAGLVDQGLAVDADFVYPIVARADCDAKYPQLKRTWLRVSEGTFTGGNAILIDRDFALRSHGRIEGLYQARKQPLKLAAMIGYSILARAIVAQKVWAGALTIPAVEEAAGRVMGGKLKAVLSKWPEIGEDIDHPGDFELAESILSARSAAEHPAEVPPGARSRV